MKLKVGQVFRNYKEVCEWLEVTPAKKGATNTRKSHIKEFERHCIFHKEGQKFIVDEVKPVVDPKVDGRKNNKGCETRKGKYGDYLEKSILYYLVKNRLDDDCKMIHYSITDLFTNVIPLFTETYGELFNYPSFAHIHSMRRGLVRDYKYKLRDKLTGNKGGQLTTALNRLKKKGFILWQKNMAYRDYRMYAEQGFDIIWDTEFVKKIRETEKFLEDEYDEFKPSKRITEEINKKFKNMVIKNLDFNGFEEYSTLSSYWNVYSITIQVNKAEFDKLVDEYYPNIDFEEREDWLTDFTKILTTEIHKAVCDKDKNTKFSHENIGDIEDMIRIDKSVFWFYVPYDDMKTEAFIKYRNGDLTDVWGEPDTTKKYHKGLKRKLSKQEMDKLIDEELAKSSCQDEEEFELPF